MQVFSNSQLRDDDYCGDGVTHIGAWAFSDLVHGFEPVLLSTVSWNKWYQDELYGIQELVTSQEALTCCWSDTDPIDLMYHLHIDKHLTYVMQ